MNVYWMTTLESDSLLFKQIVCIRDISSCEVETTLALCLSNFLVAKWLIEVTKLKKLSILFFNATKSLDYLDLN